MLCDDDGVWEMLLATINTHTLPNDEQKSHKDLTNCRKIEPQKCAVLDVKKEEEESILCGGY